MHPPAKRWPLGGLKGRLCGGTYLSSAALAVADAGGWGLVIRACVAAEAGKGGTPDVVEKGGRR